MITGNTYASFIVLSLSLSLVCSVLLDDVYHLKYSFCAILYYVQNRAFYIYIVGHPVKIFDFSKVLDTIAGRPSNVRPEHCQPDITLATVQTFLCKIVAIKGDFFSYCFSMSSKCYSLMSLLPVNLLAMLF